MGLVRSKSLGQLGKGTRIPRIYGTDVRNIVHRHQPKGEVLLLLVAALPSSEFGLLCPREAKFNASHGLFMSCRNCVTLRLYGPTFGHDILKLL